MAMKRGVLRREGQRSLDIRNKRYSLLGINKICRDGVRSFPLPTIPLPFKKKFYKMQDVSNIILVLSGKGGVGKSSVTAQLALTLTSLNKRVGILDIDLTGPSIPRLFGLESEKIHQSTSGWVPVYTDDSKSLGIISVGFLLSSPTDPVIWRGPKKNAMIKQFINDVCWGKLDYLLIDTPPGTSDEHISVMGYLRGLDVKGGVLVTTPQMVSLQDVKREINFCKKVRVFKALQHNLKLLF